VKALVLPLTIGILVGLFPGVLAIVIGFGSSTRLAAAYGLAVTGTFVVTTVLFLAIARMAWWWSVPPDRRRRRPVAGRRRHVPRRQPDQGARGRLAAAPHRRPRLHRADDLASRPGIVARNRAGDVGLLAACVDRLCAADPPLLRLPGTAVFLGADPASTPLALRAHVEHAHALHRAVILLCVVTDSRAHVPSSERIRMPASLRLAAAGGLTMDLRNGSYYVSRTSLTRTEAPVMRQWRKRLFLALARLTANPVAYFNLPDDRVVIIGTRVGL
jgi:KUP system potassium uptake protein